MKKVFYIIAAGFVSHMTTAQPMMKPDTTAVKSIGGIVKEVLRVISGEKGKTRNLEAFKNLFLPTARFTVHSHDETKGQPVETVDLEEFIILLTDPYYASGFIEYEINKVIEEYNGIAHVFQTYYSKDTAHQEEMGITSYQLVYFQNRWWIANVVWTGNTNGVSLPEKYKGKSKKAK